MKEIITKIKIFLHQLKCKHYDSELLRWHWTHGPIGNEPAFIEAEYHCTKCGKIVYLSLRGREAQEWAMVMGEYKLGEIKQMLSDR